MKPWCVALVLVTCAWPGLGLADGRGGEVTRAAESSSPWWETIGDPLLSGLVGRALGSNLDVVAARLAKVAAEAAVAQATAPLAPKVSVDLSGNVSPFESLGFQFGGALPTRFPGPTTDPPDRFYTGSAMLSVGWVPDLTGRAWKQRRAAKLDELAATKDIGSKAMGVSLALGTAYLDAVAASARLAVVREQVQTHRRRYDDLRARYDRGMASSLDVLQERQQLDGILALLPQAEAGVQNTRQQIALLMGDDPGEWERIRVAEGFPELTPLTWDTSPRVEDLVRPDLESARARVDAARARVDAAWRAMLPTLQVSGRVGYQANYLEELKTQDTWSLAATLSVPLFEGGATLAAIERAQTGLDTAKTRLRQLELGLQAKIDAAIRNDRALVERARLAETQVETAEATLDMALSRYTAGVDGTYLSVLAASQGVLQAKLNLIQATRDAWGNRLVLMDALGGPWTRSVGRKSR